MPWFKVDDGFAFHRKALKAGNTALGLWVRAGSWCAHQLTDGQVPTEVLALLGASSEDAEALVTAGLWDRTEDGYEFRGWHEYQPTKADVEEERSKARERQKEWRKNRRHAVTDGVTNAVTSSVTGAVTDAVSHGGSNGAPSLPFPSLPKDTTSEVADAPSDLDDESDDVPPIEPREDVERVCRHLQQRMVDNGYVKPAITNRWREAARLLLDRDKRTEAQVIAAIDWAQNHEFWRANIKSLPKLRTQYDTLRLQASARGGKSNVTPVDFGAQPKDPKDRPLYAADDVRARWTK
jgi:hypothetical protein